MIDVSHKFSTLRYASAQGTLRLSPAAVDKVRNRQVPKGDVLEVARAAGIQAAKRTSDWIVFCHPLPLDWVDIGFEIGDDTIVVSGEAKSIWKTGVEMEALTAVTAALLNMYDMLKPIDDDLAFGDIRLVKKRGGKSDFTDRFTQPLQAAVLVISDSTFAGEREDSAGAAVREILERQPISVQTFDVLPDERDMISARIKELADSSTMDLIFTVGGTGLGPRDITPEATRDVIDRELPGVAEAMRAYGKDRTPYAMLARGIAGACNSTLIVNLPGSRKGAQESVQALFPGLLHGLFMLWGLGHSKK